MKHLKGKYTDAIIMIDDVEDKVIEQVSEIINSRVSTGLKIRIQPDAHGGKGICIGFTMELGEYLNPNTIGVDIGCGVSTRRFKIDELNLEKVNKEILKKVPMGFNINKTRSYRLPFNEIQTVADKFIDTYNKKFGTSYVSPLYNDEWLNKFLKRIKMDEHKFYSSIGSLGGGNHFIELGKSQQTGDYFVTTHTGSRNLGQKVASLYEKIALSDETEFNELRDLIYNTTLPKSDIPIKMKELNDEFEVIKYYLKGQKLVDYCFDMIFSQQYAQWNRDKILETIRNIIDVEYIEKIDTVHNYIDFKDLIIRKGSVSAYENEKLLIPFNMRDGILICEGKSNSDWNYSAPHGAGRIFSRTIAFDTLKLEDYQKSMEGIYSTCISLRTIDESPMSYKSSEFIEKAIEPTVKVIDKIIPILNIKDNTEKFKNSKK